MLCVQINCWNESASVQSWLKAHPEVALEELYPRHMLKAYQLAAKHNRTGQAWGAPLPHPSPSWPRCRLRTAVAQDHRSAPL